MDFEKEYDRDSVRIPWNSLPLNVPPPPLPISAIYTPLKPLSKLVPILNFKPKYCSQCKGVLNPFSGVSYDTKTWKCCLCQFDMNPLPYEIKSAGKHVSQELWPLCSTVEYDLGRNLDKIAQPNISIYLLVLDTMVDPKEFDSLKASLVSAIDGLSLRHCFIGLVTFDDRHSYVLHLDPPLSYDGVFDGLKEDFSPREVVDTLNWLTPARADRFLRRPDDPGLRQTLMNLKCSVPFVAPQNERKGRCTGNAILVAARILSIFGVRHGRRIITFLGGAPTIGPGSIAPRNLSQAIRGHIDIKNRKAPLFDKAKLFYKKLEELLVGIECALDVFGCTSEEVGLTELRVAVESTGGLLVSYDSFCDPPFQESLRRAFKYNNEGLRLSSSATFEVRCSANIKVQDVLGPCKKLPGPSCSTTTEWLMCGLDVAASLCVLFENDRQGITTNDPVHIQFLTRYLHRTGHWRQRVTTIRRKCAFGTKMIEELLLGFDHEAAAIVLGRLVSHRIEREPAIFDPKGWLDQTLLHLLKLFESHQEQMKNISQLVLGLRRSPLIETFGSSPDETTYFRMIFNRESVSNAILMINPILTDVDDVDPPAIVPVTRLSVVSSADMYKIFVLDSFIKVIIFEGSGINRVRTQYGTSRWPKFVKERLKSSNDYARLRAEGPGRFPVSVLICTTKDTPEAQVLTAKATNPLAVNVSLDAYIHGLDSITASLQAITFGA